jgi:DNA-directed RNA polymerase subunit K/omega
MGKKPTKKEELTETYDQDDVEVDDEVNSDEEFSDDSSSSDKDEIGSNPDPTIIDDSGADGCIIDEVIEADEEYFETNDETEIPVELDTQFVSKENRVSSNRLTKYEMVRILGERTKQLTMGAKPMIKNHKGLSYDKIAEEEFKLNMIPFKIKRPLPNGKFEIWTLDELSKNHLISLLD